MRYMRILIRNFRDGIRSVFRNFSLSIASITCITITLILVAIAIVISANVDHFTKRLEETMTIVVYLKEDVTEEQKNDIEEEIKKLRNYDSLVYKSKDEWKQEMIDSSEELGATLSYLDTNPLLDSITVKVTDIKSLSYVASAIRGMDGVKSAKYGEESVDKLVFIFDIVEKAMIVIVCALILVTAFLISNTIKLTIFSRRSEIEIKRLVGTSNFAIRQPFIIEGFILGIIGSLIPIIITIYGYILLYDHFDGYLFSHIVELIKPMNIIWFVSIILAIIGGLVGMFGSSRAVRKYLKI
ncbi:efflux ABC transporter permease protein [Mycoplasma sp. CAG:956]|nr:efflux ABC transporter permease protein [Mycoplasma sp. CAG:956]